MTCNTYLAKTHLFFFLMTNSCKVYCSFYVKDDFSFSFHHIVKGLLAFYPLVNRRSTDRWVMARGCVKAYDHYNLALK